MSKKKKIHLEIIVTVVLSVGILLLSASYFSVKNRETVMNEERALLEERSVYYSSLICKTLQSRSRAIDNAAELLEASYEIGLSELEEKLDAVEKNSVIDAMFFVNKEGICILNNGESVDWSSDIAFIKGMQNEKGIAVKHFDGEDTPKGLWICCYAPLHENGEICGVVMGCNYYRNIEELVDSETIMPIRSALINSEGNVLLVQSEASETSGSLEKFLNSMPGEAYEEYKNSIQQRTAGSFEYKGAAGNGLACVAPVGIEDWYIIQMYSSESIYKTLQQLKKYSVVALLGGLVSALLMMSMLMHQLWLKKNRRAMLLETSLDIIGEYFPRIAKVDFLYGTCEFIKDKENTIGKQFVNIPWQEFLDNFLQQIHPEETENCKAFFSIENIRRINNSGQESATCIYRRIYEGEYQWIQAVIIPTKNPAMKNSVLIYARNVDESVKAEELHKKQLWELVQQARKSENEKEEYLRYLSNDLQVPVNALVRTNEQAIKAYDSGDEKLARTYMGIIDDLGQYVTSMIGDVSQVGIYRGRKVASRKGNFSLRSIVEGAKVYYDSTGEASLEIHYEDTLKQKYYGDPSRIIQVMNSLISPLFQYNHCDEKKNGSDPVGVVRMDINVARSENGRDLIAFAAIGDSGVHSKEYEIIISTTFPDAESEGSVKELSPAAMALQSMQGVVKMNKDISNNNFEVLLWLEHAQTSGDIIS